MRLIRTSLGNPLISEFAAERVTLSCHRDFTPKWVANFALDFRDLPANSRSGNVELEVFRLQRPGQLVIGAESITHRGEVAGGI